MPSLTFEVEEFGFGRPRQAAPAAGERAAAAEGRASAAEEPAGAEEDEQEEEEAVPAPPRSAPVSAAAEEAEGGGGGAAGGARAVSPPQARAPIPAAPPDPAVAFAKAAEGFRLVLAGMALLREAGVEVDEDGVAWLREQQAALLADGAGVPGAAGR